MLGSRYKEFEHGVVGAKEIIKEAEEFPQAFARFSSEDLRYFRQLIRRGNSNGVLWLILSVFCFSCGMGFLIAAWFEKRMTESKIQNFSRDMLSAKNEARRSDDRPGIISAILSPINKKEPNEFMLPDSINDFFKKFSKMKQENLKGINFRGRSKMDPPAAEMRTYLLGPLLYRNCCRIYTASLGVFV